MSSNKKLTALIRGRKIESYEEAKDLLTISFENGSRMTVKISETISSPSFPTGQIKSVLQDGTKLNLQFIDGSSISIHTIEATSCVMVRDKDNNLEYAD